MLARYKILGIAVVLAGLHLPQLAAAADTSERAAVKSADSLPAPSSIVADPTRFPEPAILKPVVGFWRDVFAKYSENQSIVHSTLEPDKVLAVMDFSSEAQSMSKADFYRFRQHREQQLTVVAEKAFRGIIAADGDPKKMTDAERRVYNLYGGGGTRLFKRMIGTLRVQHGLRERTGHALEVAGRYMPKMEKTFAGYGLPEVLTRLPLVESSFNLDAYSKVGAAGIWQFIPSSARIYMKLNAIQDDRRDPWISTDAAARHLKDDYDALGQWPLALTAYNYGRGGIAHALKQVHGSTLTDLLQHYDNPRFGFASRNFYAEFLAASQVAAQSEHYFGKLHHDQPIRFDVVHTTDYVPYSTLQTLSGLNAQDFRTLNPSFDDAVVEDRLYVPPGTAVRVPPGYTHHFETLYAALGPNERFDRQRVWYVAYRVRRGDVLGSIASRHNVSVDELMRYNHLRSPRLIRVGQELRIPTGGPLTEAPHLVAAVAHTNRVITHRVERGQTLSSIAAHYHVSVDALLRDNHLRSARLLRAGQILRIPTKDNAAATGTGTTQVASAQPAVVERRVQPGQTLSGIADRYDTSVHALLAANDNLDTPRDLRAGQHLTIPVGNDAVASVQPTLIKHQVRPGQTLSGIATRYHTSVGALLAENHLSSPRALRAGQTLQIPTDDATQPHPVATRVATAQPSVIVHRVRAGQTLSGIASRYSSSIAAIRRLNGLDDVDFLKVGMHLKIPQSN